MNSKWIDSSQIYLLILHSRIDSYSYLQKCYFMNIIHVCKYYNFRNGIPFCDYFSNYWWIPKLYILYMYNIWKYHTTAKFDCKEERKKEKKEKIYIVFRYSWIICAYFPSEEYYSNSYFQVLKFTNYSYSYSYRCWLSNLFLFQFAIIFNTNITCATKKITTTKTTRQRITLTTCKTFQGITGLLDPTTTIRLMVDNKPLVVLYNLWLFWLISSTKITTVKMSLLQTPPLIYISKNIKN